MYNEVTCAASLVPRPRGRREKWPGIHCLRMRERVRLWTSYTWLLCGEITELDTRLAVWPEEVVQVYGFCIRTLRLPVISVMIIGVMRLSYNERAVPDGRFRHHLFQAVFMRTTYPSRYVYFRWSRVHTAVETAVTAPVGM